jgi:hypothetical protein
MSDEALEKEEKVRGVVAAMTALGEAYRGDWHDFDGRWLRSQLEELGTVFEKALRGEDTTGDVAAFYAFNGICSQCGSWTEHCDCVSSGGVSGV